VPDIPPQETGWFSFAALSAVATGVASGMVYLYSLVGSTRRETSESVGKLADKIDGNIREQRQETLADTRDLYKKFDEHRAESARQFNALRDQLDTQGRLIVQLPTRQDLALVQQQTRDDLRERDERLMDAIKMLDKRKQDKGNGQGSGD
jgi:hypothetical protein